MPSTRWALLSLVILCACPKADEPESKQKQDAGTVTPCAAHEAWDERCAQADDIQTDEPSWAESECPKDPWHYVRPKAIDAMIACLKTLPCDTHDDMCTDAAFQALGITQASDLADDKLYLRCEARVGECQMGDSCYVFPFFTEAGRAKAATCLELACDSVKPCLDNPDTY